MSNTPRTDDLARGNHVVPTEFAKDLERELNESRDDAEHWKIEWEIVEARLCGWKHPRDNGIIFEHEIIPKLQRERDEAREKLDEEMKWHHRTHTELIQAQCKLLDIEMKCDVWKECADRLYSSSGWHDEWPMAVQHYKQLKKKI